MCRKEKEIQTNGRDKRRIGEKGTEIEGEREKMKEKL